MNIVIDIEEKWNSDMSAEPRLYLSDDPKELISLTSEGHFAVPVLTDKNRDADFSSYKYIVSDPDNIDHDSYVKIWQRYASLPWHILDSDRLTVREMCPSDLDDLYHLYKDKSVTRFMEDLFPDPADELQYIHNYIKNVYSYWNFGTWNVYKKDSGELVGRAGFNYRPDYEEPELGFMIGAAYQRQGYAFEVCKAILDYGFNELEFSSVQAMADRENTASVSLLKKLGFSEAPGHSDLQRYLLKK
jgi:RimJ/RimL family protein N-acetyltransferase